MMRLLIRLSALLKRKIVSMIGLSTLLIRTMRTDRLIGLIRWAGVIRLIVVLRIMRGIRLLRRVIAIEGGRPAIEILTVTIWRTERRTMRGPLAICGCKVASTARGVSARAALGPRLG